MTTTVSVAMATHMGSAYVVQQLTSILEQTVPPAEIVVCDDRSSDETARLITEFAGSSAIPVRLFVNEERLGWRGNFMRAASLCESEVIAFCDQDDVWDRRKLEHVVTEFEHAETLVVFHDATVVGADLEPIGPFLQGAGEPDRARALERGPWSDVYGLTMAFRRELLALWTYWRSSTDKSVGAQRAAHDQWVLFLGAALGATTHLPMPLTSYRQHDRNAVGAKDAGRPASRITALLRYRDVVNLRQVVLDGRIGILREIVGRHDGFERAAAAALAAHLSYRSRIVLQLGIHNSSSPLRRLGSYAALLSRGSYSGGAWGLERRMAFDDGVAALLGPTGLAWLRGREARRREARRSTA